MTGRDYIQMTEYDAVGRVSRSAHQDANRYKYGGKDWESRNGLNWYDFSARPYDPATLRFTTTDPLALQNSDASPYMYCHANPTNRIDPTGMTDFFVPDSSLKINIDDGVNQVFEVNEEQFIRLSSEDLTAEDYNSIIEAAIPRPDVFPTINNVLEGEEFVYFKDVGGNCLTAAIAQNNVGVETADKRIDVYPSQSPSLVAQGESYIVEELKMGHSVIVGMTTGRNVKNNNESTGHFVNICGSGFNMENGRPVSYFFYYDNGSKIYSIDISVNRFFKVQNGSKVEFINRNRKSKSDGSSPRMTEIRRNKN